MPSTWTYDSEAGLNVGSRKGPHGGYTTGTQKCALCHTIHGTTGVSPMLLPEATIAATCYTCHDGTGGGGVYGVIYQRTGIDPQEASATASGGTRGGVHRIGASAVPGGDPSGATSYPTFSDGGTLTCTDCHSPHNSNTVAPFIGDRKRSAADTSSALATNRLLKRRPTTATSSVDYYGQGWCRSCHKGIQNDGSHATAGHIYSGTDANRNYSKVIRLASYDTSVTSATPGPLGGSNLGFIMPDTIQGTGGHTERPICQQCHEDARDVGGNNGAANQFQVSSTTQVFNPTLDGLSNGNPRFQNFPHETINDAFTIEPKTDTLCLNCHWI